MLHETDYRKLLTFADGIVFPQTQSQRLKQHVILAVILHHTTIIFHYHFVSLVFSRVTSEAFTFAAVQTYMKKVDLERMNTLLQKNYVHAPPPPPPPPKYLRQRILYVNCFGRTVLYMSIEYHI